MYVPIVVACGITPLGITRLRSLCVRYVCQALSTILLSPPADITCHYEKSCPSGKHSKTRVKHAYCERGTLDTTPSQEITLGDKRWKKATGLHTGWIVTLYKLYTNYLQTIGRGTAYEGKKECSHGLPLDDSKSRQND